VPVPPPTRAPQPDRVLPSTLMGLANRPLVRAKVLNRKNMDITDPREKLATWLVKIDFLKDQINKPGQLKDFPIFAIATFLLKCQIVEFELKHLIFSLDLHLSYHNKSKLLKRISRIPRFLDNLTLGRLKIELDQFINLFDIPVLPKTNKPKRLGSKNTLVELKSALDLLVAKRNEFTHRLFSPGKDISEMNKEAEKGLRIADKTITLLEKLEKEIKDYD
ncbi:MAG: hypothetical protein ACD_57C00346G0001, partial [uncultured bacterium]